MKIGWKQALLAVVALAVVHLGLALIPEASFSPSVSFALFMTNLYVLYAATAVLAHDGAADSGGRHLGVFILGYFILFLLVLVLLDRKPLFILLLIVYASVFRSPFLLGLFALFVLSFVVLQPYAVETFVPFTFTYLVMCRSRRRSRFVRACLGGGLLALSAVLFPLLHLVVQDSAQTLWHALSRPDVQEAISLSVASSTVATVVLALWAVPLAYAMARVEFSGKRFVESLIDVPILVPQSVAGLALMVLLGPGSPLGHGLQQSLGLKISGSLLGIVIAQVFVASPFLIKTAMTAFEAIPEQLEMASRTLGASAATTFWRISLPLASRGIAVGMILAWARAISELGAIMLFAGSPATAPVLVHNEFLRAGVEESRPIAILLLIICLWIFVILQFGQTLLPFALRRGPRYRRP